MISRLREGMSSLSHFVSFQLLYKLTDLFFPPSTATTPRERGGMVVSGEVLPKTSLIITAIYLRQAI